MADWEAATLPARTTRIGLIRHGETAWNITGRWQGHAPVPLNDEGRLQAQLLAEHLAPLADQVAAICSSDLSRAAATAAAIGAAIMKPPQLDPRLREIDLGDWQGLTREDVLAWDRERYDHVHIDAHNIPRPGGESTQNVVDRATAAIREIVARHRGQFVLIVSHGGTIRGLLEHYNLLNGDAQHAWIGNTSVSVLVYDHDADTWTLESFNQMQHLEARRTVKGGIEG
jgi:probable phosphoglycerate mutase